jgi:hypothetical protein
MYKIVFLHTLLTKNGELESDTVLKCIFCILCQLRHTSEKPRDDPFQNWNRICHAHPLWFTMDIWRMTFHLENRRNLTQVGKHMPKSPQWSTSISWLPVWYWSLNLLLYNLTESKVSAIESQYLRSAWLKHVRIPLETHDFLQGLVHLWVKSGKLPHDRELHLYILQCICTGHLKKMVFVIWNCYIFSSPRSQEICYSNTFFTFCIESWYVCRKKPLSSDISTFSRVQNSCTYHGFIHVHVCFISNFFIFCIWLNHDTYVYEEKILSPTMRTFSAGKLATLQVQSKVTENTSQFSRTDEWSLKLTNGHSPSLWKHFFNWFHS